LALHETALISMEQGRAALDLAKQSQDADLELAINALTIAFEREVGGPLKARTLTDYRLDGTGGDWLVLPFIPVQSIAKLDIRYTDGTSYLVLIDDTKWTVGKKSGLLELVEDCFVEGRQNILVTMSVGWAPGDLELAELQMLLIMQLKVDWNRIKNNEIGLSSRTMADGGVNFAGGWGVSPPRRFLLEVSDGLERFKDKRP
jgi:hypothetical protein